MRRSLLFVVFTACGIPLGGTGSEPAPSPDASVDEAAGPAASSEPPTGSGNDASGGQETGASPDGSGADVTADAAPDVPGPCTTPADCPADDDVCLGGGVCTPCGAAGTDDQPCKVGGNCKEEDSKCET